MDFSDQDVLYPCLEIMDNKQHSRTKVLTLKVHSLVIGAFPLVRKTLDTSHHLPEWSSIEMKDVIDNSPATSQLKKFSSRSLLLIKMLMLPSLLIMMKILAVGVFLLSSLVRFAICLAIGSR
ncbi:hypothetical protein KY290_033532 [Solanum tuberosum]|uniref:Uncharacterized protein n=1 Tax=Solanum tuberosum TaxID=4113 RepID=A0ABQ7U1N5_SOLTU|nr:hypothetical protein KY289_032891 [Solanum tuberosum]KAH0647537.1 hypothetical protein KY285_032785 [Solanum tuberosum]KAH0740489.1 hypothetical protein KY290_033532 [Solanum tuberosum]